MNNDDQANSNQDTTKKQKAAAEQLILNRLNQLYGDDGDNSNNQPTAPETPIAATKQPSVDASNPIHAQIQQKVNQISQANQNQTANPYQQTYNQSDYQQQVNTDWQKYHSAWQNYYQKYYEYYYTQQLQQSNQSTDQADQNQQIDPEDSALDELRDKIRKSMVQTAVKARKSHHFWPIVSALAVGLLFFFLQYNRLLIAQAKAYITPAEQAPSIIVTNPTVKVDVGPDPWLIIPKINVKVPVIYNITNDEASQQKAMQSGVAHFAIPGASSVPGEVGNTILNGHSSNDVFDKGDYKFVFTKLDKMKKDDVIYIDYKRTRYTYNVIRTEVIWPNQINKLTYKTTKPMLTLITCTPIGTSRQRLLVTAEQISPDPKSAPTSSEPQIVNNKKSAIPGNSDTLLERLFNIFK